MKLFTELVVKIHLKPFAILAKRVILDVWVGPECDPQVDTTWVLNFKGRVLPYIK